MRKFILHTYNKKSSFNLNTASALAVEPTGLGNAFNIAYKDTSDGKHAINVKSEFEPIAVKIYFNTDGTNGYINYKALLTFLTACGKDKLLFEYIDGVTDKYTEVILKSATKSEISEDGLFYETFTFEKQTYWFEQIETTFELSTSDTNPSFPLSFPFGFLGLTFTNSIRVKNAFFEPAPITIKISGEIEENIRIFVSTIDEVIVSEIELSCGNTEGRTIVFEPAEKKIYLIDSNGNITDGYNLTNKAKQSFLYIPQGEYLIGTNTQSTDVGKVEIAIKRYLLD